MQTPSIHKKKWLLNKEFMNINAKIDWIYEEEADSAITLCSWLEQARPVEAGMIFVLLFENVERLMVVGHCTPFCEPTQNDGGIGWEHSIAKSYKVLKAGRITTNLAEEVCGGFYQIQIRRQLMKKNSWQENFYKQENFHMKEGLNGGNK